MKKVKVKKIILLILAIVISLMAVLALFSRYQHIRDVEFKTAGNLFQIIQGGQPRDFLVKGVNMGAGKPGSFPGEMQITKEEYKRWFRQIADMNANTVRIYTIHPPAFYEALFEYNLFANTPLYIFHGVWLNEEAVENYRDALAPAITEDFENEMKKLIGVLHGDIVIQPVKGHAFGTYRWDVSPYVAGYILGIELDADFVINTNEQNAQISSYDGNFLYTERASPYECWLAQIGDFAISYEHGKYGVQKPISWVNWLTTDPIWHSNEPNQAGEDAVSVDTEHILAKDSFHAGLFASYHIYPYYPEFIMFQPEYASYVDDVGKTNPYKAYLLDLKAHHSVPVLVAEFGVPSSRGCTHENVLTGYNQGGLTEQQQGEYVSGMFDDIVSAGYAGGLAFTWQDEWFKRSWNTMDLDIPERRPYWSNYQVSEQFFGLLAFDPGEKRAPSHTDGDLSEWAGQKPVCQANGIKLYAKSDERFVYFMISDDGPGSVEEKRYVIGVDSVSGQGNRNFSDTGISFSGQPDFAVLIDGRDNSSVMVDAYYDAYYRQYSLLGIVPEDKRFEVKDSGIFNPVRLLLSAELTLPLTSEVIPARFYETGRLLHSNSDPDSEDYNSLADFYINPDNHSIEMRIPWQLLNIADPSAKIAIGDFYENAWFDINPVEINGLSLELHAIHGNVAVMTGIGFYYWDAWYDTVNYHERLKESYYIVQENFIKYGR